MLLTVLMPVLCLVPIAHGAEAPAAAVDAGDILRTVREAQSVKRQTLSGQLRTDAGVTLPFLLVSDGPRIQYRFQPPAPAVTFQVQLNDENSELQEIGSGEQAHAFDLRKNRPFHGSHLRGPRPALPLLVARPHRGRGHHQDPPRLEAAFATPPAGARSIPA